MDSGSPRSQKIRVRLDVFKVFFSSFTVYWILRKSFFDVIQEQKVTFCVRQYRILVIVSYSKLCIFKMASHPVWGQNKLVFTALTGLSFHLDWRVNYILANSSKNWRTLTPLLFFSVWKQNHYRIKGEETFLFHYFNLQFPWGKNSRTHCVIFL